MMKLIKKLRRFAHEFVHDTEGASTVEFVMVFPMFMLFFGMTYENGMISLRHVMLERGVDMTVREVRIGAQIGSVSMVDPSRETLKERICEHSAIIPDCMNQLQLEILIRDAHAWVDVPGEVQCVDRGDPEDADTTRNVLANNQLVFLRACARFDPMMPTTGIGKAIVDSNSNDAAGGSYALVSTAAFVVEPFKSLDL